MSYVGQLHIRKVKQTYKHVCYTHYVVKYVASY